MAEPATFSPVTQVTDASAPAPPEERTSEEQFNSQRATPGTYRDLLIFEERLKLNMIRLRKRQQKYEGTAKTFEVETFLLLHKMARPLICVMAHVRPLSKYALP